MVGSFKNVGKKPKPFQRPGIDLDRVKRSWQNVLVRWLNEDDIVQDKGRVMDITYHIPESGPTVYLVTFMSGEQWRVDSNVEVFAFSEIYVPKTSS